MQAAGIWNYWQSVELDPESIVPCIGNRELQLVSVLQTGVWLKVASLRGFIRAIVIYTLYK